MVGATTKKKPKKWKKKEILKGEWSAPSDPWMLSYGAIFAHLKPPS
jgi:hypothetical protein